MFPPFGPVVQLVRTPACHAGGRGFEPLPGRQHASVAQLVEQWTENPCVTGSIPVEGTITREWLSGRASPCQGERREFESRLPLQYAGVVELADALDSKSSGGDIVWVRLPPPAPERTADFKNRQFFQLNPSYDRINTAIADEICLCR